MKFFREQQKSIKKYILLFLCVLAITFSIGNGVYASVRSDVNQDNQIGSTDAMLTMRNSIDFDMTNTDWQISTTMGDVNCDHSLNSTDAMLILRYSLGLNMDETVWCE